MTAPDATGTLEGTVEVDYGQWYLYDLAAADVNPDLVGDPIDDAALWENRCAASGGAAIVYTLKQYGPTSVVVRSVSSPPPLDERADHVAECSIAMTGGRLAISGWDSSNVAGVLQVPVLPLRVRIGWFGLQRELDTDDEAHERFELDVFPGPAAPVEVLRCWPTWEPPTHESTTPDGLRLYRGQQAARARESMEWIPLMFWPPYPETSDGDVMGLWRDPTDDSRWADGSGSDGHRFLRELSTDEVADLEAQGFPSVRTYAIDADGRVWTSDVFPLERVPCLNLVPPWQFEMVKGLEGGLVGVQVIDLPPGWSRIFRRPRDGGGPPVEVATIDDADAPFYTLWRDDQPAPTS